MEVLPPERWLPAHQAMIYFGRAICHPKIPSAITIRNFITLKTFKKRGLMTSLSYSLNLKNNHLDPKSQIHG